MNLSGDTIVMIIKRREQEKACRGGEKEMMARAAKGRVGRPAFKYVKETAAVRAANTTHAKAEYSTRLDRARKK